MKAGMFISLEGAEGVGKTTQLNYICQYFAKQGVVVTRTREPGGTPLAERIRELLLGHDEGEKMSDDTELLLMFSARAQHIHQVIRPGLEKGFVVSDRFTDATYAYQGGGRGIAAERIKCLEEWVQQGLQPDATILLDAPVEVGQLRAGKRSAPDRIESEEAAFFQRVRQTYLQRAKQSPDRYHIVDAVPSEYQVKMKIQPLLDKLLEQAHG